MEHDAAEPRHRPVPAEVPGTVLTLLLALLTLAPCASSSSRAAECATPPAFPQYLAFHVRSPRPAATNMLQKLGTRGTATRRLAFSCSISYLNVPDTAAARRSLKKRLRRILSLAQKQNIPVIIHLDGVNWWGARPELWNWWNPDKPGYDPDNRQNVEWHDREPKHAVTIGWRNWGSQIRVGPQPNLLSPEFLRESDQMLRALVPVIAEWFRNLPRDKKYLLGGVVLGWEISPYIQHFYYPDGNTYLEKHPEDASHDPTGGIQRSIPLGYAAAASLGIEHEGTITTADLEKIIRAYSNHITRTARRAGLPRRRIILHGKVFEGTERGGAQSGRGVLNRNAVEGWSFYGTMPSDIDSLLDELDGTPWAAIEVQPWGLTGEKVEAFFEHRNCRVVNVFNWRSVRDKADVLAALRPVLRKSPELLMPPRRLQTSRQDGRVRFRWRPGSGAVSTELLISGDKRTDIDGVLSEVAVRKDVTGQSTCELRLEPGTYWWMLVAEGGRGTGKNRMPSRLHRVSVSQ